MADDLLAPVTPAERTPAPPSPDLFNELVGEGRKYKTPLDAARALLHKDEFIDQLKRENAEMRTDREAARAELNTRMKLEEFVTKIEASRTPITPVEPSTREPSTTPALTDEQLEARIEQTINQVSEKRTA